ncbi:glycosyltransferase [Paenibacillus sp. GYB003]|uniref:glycosyltransferase n=1 Tax=Paenibacillus sp. GYB003 TaxID=2994392 RepID=UPI002F9691FB
MNIAIDVLAILGPDSKNRGIGNYSTSQLKKLFELDKSNRYFLLNFYEDIDLKSLLNYSDNVSEHYFYLGKGGFLGKDKSFSELFGELIKKFIKEHDIEIYYFTSPFDALISYNMDWFEDVTTIATLYDIIPYVFKNRYLADKFTYNQYMGHISNLKKINKLLAISKSAKVDVVHHIHIDPEKIDVIYAGTDECYKKIEISEDDLDEIKQTYSIKDQFIMCTGGDDDRKNIGGLITAFSKMPRRLIDQYQLVIACKLSRESMERYYNIASKHNVRDRIILTNFVPLDHLVKLYNLAHIVAFPSQYEGFGLPVVEAMACGTPVLTSNNSSLGEIASGAAVLVDPFDINDITRGLVEILENTDLNKLKEEGYERVKQFNWNNVSLSTLNAINAINAIKPMKVNKIENKKKKIAFFTPLPPLQSGIADYSFDIINGLSNFFDIDVYIDKNYTPECEFAHNISVYEHTSFYSQKYEYDDVIFQMGNSEFHAYMLDYIKTTSGTLVLHDYNLHGLLYHITAATGDMEKYKRFLYEDYPNDFVDHYINELRMGRSHPKIFELPTNGVVINYAKKIIVHSDYAKKLLLEKNIQRSVRKILHYAEIKEIPDLKEIRKKYKIDENKIILSAFGHIHETKRIMPIVKAFKKLSENHDNVLLYLVGQPSSSTGIKDELEQYLKNNDLKNKVVVTGYTELDSFEEYMEATDICMNLRFPYNGETSGSLMRILAKGKCVLISDIGSFKEIPDHCCIKIKSPENLTLEEEISLVYQKLKELVVNPEKIKELGENARQYAKNNLDIEKITKQYVDCIISNRQSYLTEQVLKDLIEYISNKKNEEDIYELSKTLVYLK